MIEKTELEKLSTEEIGDVIKLCHAVLAERERDERNKAITEIHKIAREHGLAVGVRKRGRKKRAGDGGRGQGNEENKNAGMEA
jgi:hypothetical protein